MKAAYVGESHPDHVRLPFTGARSGRDLAAGVSNHAPSTTNPREKKWVFDWAWQMHVDVTFRRRRAVKAGGWRPPCWQIRLVGPSDWTRRGGRPFHSLRPCRGSYLEQRGSIPVCDEGNGLLDSVTPPDVMATVVNEHKRRLGCGLLHHAPQPHLSNEASSN